MQKDELYFNKWSELHNLPKKLPVFLKWNFDIILKQIPKYGNHSILDLGTGNGILLIKVAKHNPNCTFIGVDFSKGMLLQAKTNFKKYKIIGRLIKTNLTKIPLESNSIDYIISNNVFHHVKDKKKLYQEIYRILKKKGKLIYSDSHDAVDNEFRNSKFEWVKKDNNFAKKYKKSADLFWKSLPKKLIQNHPKEYHYPLKDVRIFLLNAGFHNIKFVKSPAYFVIISATK
ncbi:MAG: class I SAM-dependent methyltransferase [Candidatus Woesearchaeota archaeon]